MRVEMQVYKEQTQVMPAVRKTMELRHRRSHLATT